MNSYPNANIWIRVIVNSMNSDTHSIIWIHIQWPIADSMCVIVGVAGIDLNIWIHTKDMNSYDEVGVWIHTMYEERIRIHIINEGYKFIL